MMLSGRDGKAVRETDPPLNVAASVRALAEGSYPNGIVAWSHHAQTLWIASEDLVLFAHQPGSSEAVVTITPISHDSALAFLPGGMVELLGTASPATPGLVCTAGSYALPFEVCEERFRTKLGLQEALEASSNSQRRAAQLAARDPRAAQSQ